MLRKIDYTGKSHSIFSCDRCGKEINKKDSKLFRILINTTRKNDFRILNLLNVKKYDLCSKCAKTLIFVIEDTKPKKEKK